MHTVLASDSWLGLLVFLGAILFQLFAAMRKGKAARPPLPGTTQHRAPAPVVRRPMPAPVPAPAPWRPEPVFVPASPSPEPRSASQLPPKLRELFEEMSAPAAPAPAPVSRAYAPAPASFPREGPSDAELLAARALEAAESAATATPAVSPALAHLRLQGRAEWQRAFLLSEVFQPPLALRRDALARGAHF